MSQISDIWAEFSSGGSWQPHGNLVSLALVKNDINSSYDQNYTYE